MADIEAYDFNTGIHADEMASRDNSTFLPAFANAENKNLDSHVRTLQKQLEEVETALEANTDRIGIIGEHLNNVQTELKYTQARVATRNKEIETETHLQKLSEREMGKLKAESEQIAYRRLELDGRLAGLQQKIYRGNEKVEQFKLLMNWNQEEMDQWMLAQKQKDEDNLALEKYRRQDEAKLKELTLRIERLTKELASKQADLDVEVTETQAVQIQLQKTAQDFRNFHNARQELIKQWDEAVEGMRRRDDAIQLAGQRFAEKKAELRQKKLELDSKARSLHNEVINNKELHAQIEMKERELAKLREQYQQHQHTVLVLQDDVDIIRTTLSKAANDLTTVASSNRVAQENLDLKRKRLDQARKRYAALRRRLASESTELDTLESKVDELEAIRKAESDRLKSITRENNDLKKEHFKRSQHLFELRQSEKELISEIAGAQSQNKNVANRMYELDASVLRQQELLYNVEFQLQQMERKVARGQGERSDDETRALNQRIEKLTGILEQVNTEHAKLLEQVKMAEENLLAARRHNLALRNEKGGIDDKIGTTKLESSSTIRQLQNFIAEKEKHMIDHDLLKLEVKRLREVLIMHSDQVFSLENRKFQLKTSVEERRQQIEIYRQGLVAQLRLLRDDLHQVTLDLKERAVKVDKLRAKYETIAKKAGLTEDGEPKSQAYYVIKAAQEREELRAEGNALDAQIRKAEKEVQALETSLLQLGGVNSKLSQSRKKVPTSTAFQERATLREKLDKAYDKLKLKKKEEAALAGDVQQAESRLKSVSSEVNALHSMVQDLQHQKADASRAMEDQQEKLLRAQRGYDKLHKQLRAKAGAAVGVLPVEQDLALAELWETNRSMLQELRMLALQFPEAGIPDILEESGVKLPTNSQPGSLAGSRQGSRPVSRTSSIDSVSSVKNMTTASKPASSLSLGHSISRKSRA